MGSWLSDIAGGIGDFIGDSGIGDIFDSDIFSTENILGGLGSFANVWSQQEQAKQIEEAAKSKFDQQIAMSNLEQQHAIELLKLKAALDKGGGGGGGGGPDYLGIERLRAIMQAKQMQVDQTNTGASNLITALGNLITAGQRPIVR